MSTLTWITDKELQREIKTKGDQFRRKKNKNFIAAVRKRGNVTTPDKTVETIPSIF